MRRRIERYLIHTIQLLRGPTGAYGLGTDQYNEPLEEATPTSLWLPARVEWDRRRMTTQAGQEVVINATVFLDSQYDDGTGTMVELVIGPEDRVVFEGRELPVIERNRCEGWAWTEDDRSHWELYVV